MYVQTGLQHVKPRHSGTTAGYAFGEIEFYHVSAVRKIKYGESDPLVPKRKFKMKVMVKQKFQSAYES